MTTILREKLSPLVIGQAPNLLYFTCTHLSVIDNCNIMKPTQQLNLVHYVYAKPTAISSWYVIIWLGAE